MIVGVPKESFPGETRVALVPTNVPSIKASGLYVSMEAGAGEAAGYTDDMYRDKGAEITKKRRDIFRSSEIILQVRGAGANPEGGCVDLELMKEGQILIGLLDPNYAPECLEILVARKVTAFALEYIPRITRAQSMDVLSSMASIAGYKAALLAAEKLPKMFPMMMTAAGTIVPARVFIIGAGVAGLQAIATAHRLGAVVNAYDVRPAVKDQIESLGAKFVELGLEKTDTETAGGYAKAMDEEFYTRQRETLSRELAKSDVVITTAAVPGEKAPLLITAEMVKVMPRGSVIVDLAAEHGGNCELTEAQKEVKKYGVTIIGPTNLPSTVPFHASQLFSKNITTFLLSMIRDGNVIPASEDEILKSTLVTKDGLIVHEGLTNSS
jgi:NAD(P) transhydrogenase subunit alpha